jgi:hypothetical protein
MVPAAGRIRRRFPKVGVVPVQASRQGDLGALALVLGVLLVLLVTSIALGSPSIR